MRPLALLVLFTLPLCADVCDQIRCPAPELGARYGCNATKLPTGQFAGWHQVRVWLKMPNLPEWSFLLSLRPPKQRLKALKDCDEYMRAIEKRIPRRKP